MIITDITELVTIVGASANGSINIEDIQPDFDNAVEDILVPVIGDDLIEEIMTRTEPIYIKLRPLLKKAVAYLGLYNFSLHASVQMSSNGMMRLEGEGVRASFRYQEYDYQAYTLNTGWDAIEKLLLAAEAGKQDLIDENSWSDELNDATQTHLLNYANTMRKMYNMRVSRAIFEMMKPVIDDVENYMIKPILTDVVYTQALTYRRGLFNNPPSVLWDKLISLTHRAIVHIVVRESVIRNWVRVDKEGIVAVETTADQTSVNKTPANNNQLNVITRAHEEWARRVIVPLREYLVANALDLGYVIEEVPVEETIEDACAERYRCNCHGKCFCSRDKGRAALSL